MLLIILFISLGIAIFLLNKYTRREKSTNITDNITPLVEQTEPEVCCGAHEVCEKDSLLATSPDAVYFEDEELDVFRFRDEKSYSEKEIAQFEEVFFTLREDEIAEWLKSLQIRNINLPYDIKEEALLIVSERRYAHTH
jgi:hypothetical protein